MTGKIKQEVTAVASQETIGTDAELLKSALPKEPWDEKKQGNEVFHEVLEWVTPAAWVRDGFSDSFEDALADFAQYREMMKGRFSHGKLDRVLNCANTLEFMDYADGTKKLYRAWFCKDRLCPMCNWRRSRKLTGQVMKIMQTLVEREPANRPVFLTLTVRNVKGAEIAQCITELSRAFRRLMERKEVERFCRGAMRVIEITYSRSRDDYHVHIHSLLWMEERYFKSRNIILKDRWIKLWRQSVRADYDPSIDIQAVRRKRTKEDPTGYIKSILELTKYTVKLLELPGMDGSVLNMPDDEKMKAAERIEFLENGLRHKRLVSMWGVIKDLHKELNLDDAETGDLVGADEEGEGEAIGVSRYDYMPDGRHYRRTATGKLKTDSGNNLYVDYNEGADLQKEYEAFREEHKRCAANFKARCEAEKRKKAESKEKDRAEIEALRKESDKYLRYVQECREKMRGKPTT